MSDIFKLPLILLTVTPVKKQTATFMEEWKEATTRHQQPSSWKEIPRGKERDTGRFFCAVSPQNSLLLRFCN